MARRLYHAAPSGFWRMVSGLENDVRSLPARLADPERRREPWQTIHHVGGDYRAHGLASLEILTRYGALTASDRVLDIGCGNGRVAWPLVGVLGPEGRYDGFDVSRPAIAYCRRRIAAAARGFRFHHLDVRNTAYNRRGRVDEAHVVFPCADASVTLAFAMSVLTHLSWPTILRYLEETRRVLAPGGRALFTAFLLTPQVRGWAAEGLTAVPLQAYGARAMTSDPHWPENAMAYDQDMVSQAIGEAGLRLESVLAGGWRPEATYPGGQDLLVVRRPLDVPGAIAGLLTPAGAPWRAGRPAG